MKRFRVYYRLVKSLRPQATSAIDVSGYDVYDACCLTRSYIGNDIVIVHVLDHAIAASNGKCLPTLEHHKV